jgi:hypothetical protein
MIPTVIVGQQRKWIKYSQPPAQWPYIDQLAQEFE